MQYLSRLFFSFDGRIAAPITDSIVTLGAVSIVGSLIIQPDYFTAAVTRPVAQAVLTLVLAVPQLAICIKRFRPRMASMGRVRTCWSEHCRYDCV